MSLRRHPRRSFRFFPLFLALSPLAAAAGAQEGPDVAESFGEQVTVDVVNVEAWVTDRRGEPVTGLTADDFQLLVDGEPVEIRYFNAFSETEEEPFEEVLPSGLAQEELLRVVVMVDDWNLRPEDRARVLDDLRGFLDRELRPGEEVMVVVHDGSSIAIAQELTADRESLAGVLDRLGRRAAPGIGLDSERRETLREIERSYRGIEEVQAVNALLDLEPCVDGWPEMEAAFRTYAAAAANHAQTSASAIASVVGSLAGLPGTKVLVYVGNGLPDQPAADVLEYLRQLCSHRQSEINNLMWGYDLNPVYDQVVDQANAHRVTLYMLEAEKPGTFVEQGSTDPRFRLSAQAVALREGSRESGLVRLADETGGRAVLDAADFAPALGGVGRDLRHYYSLGFVPRGSAEGATHRLEVRLKDRKGHRVRHRTSYREKPLELRMMERVYAVAGLAGQQNPLGARIEIGDAHLRSDGSVSVPIRIWTPLDEITLLPSDEGAEGRLRLMMVVAGGAGDADAIRQKMVPVKVGAVAGEDEGGARREKLIEVNLDLTPGRHWVAIGLRDEIGGEASYLRHEVEVAPPAVASDGT